MQKQWNSANVYRSSVDLFPFTQEVVENSKSSYLKETCQRIDFYYLTDYLNILGAR